MEYGDLMPFLKKGKLVRFPSKRKKQLLALAWLAEHIPPDAQYTEAGFNELLDCLHSFEDPATLRRELCDTGLVKRSADGTRYRLNPERPSPEELLAFGEKAGPSDGPAETAIPIGYSERDWKDAAEFREQIHAEALRRVRQFRPQAQTVIDHYSVESYFQRVWDYPGAWYTVVAIPESAGSREALIDRIVRDTLAGRL